jgi:FkbM family methyltransferase
VIAIEAVPELVEAGRIRFFNELHAGRLSILNLAVAEEAGECNFWVCDDLTTWSSLDETIAARDGKKYHKIRVKTSRFRDILLEFGSPYYLKVDIETADRFCLADLDNHNLPTFVSVETECGGAETPLTERNYLATFGLLRERGFNRFKLVSQHTLTPVFRSNLNHALDPKYRHTVREQIERDNNWRFPEESSGPWGNGIPGPWMEFTEALDVYCTCRELFFQKWNMPWYLFWFDWHATRF